MHNVTWPAAAKLGPFRLAITAHSRGGAGGAGGTGHYAYERGPGARWRGELEVRPMRLADACTFRAFLHSLRGRSGTFLLPIPAGQPAAERGARYSDGTDYTDGADYTDTLPATLAATAAGTLASAAAAGADTLVVSSGLAADAMTVVGALAVVGNVATTGQLVRITGIAGTTLTIRPRLRAAYSLGAAVTVGRVTGKFRLDMETPPVPLIGDRSRAVTLEIAESY